MYWTGFLQLSFYHSKLRFFLVRWASERNDMTRKKLDGGSKTCDISGSLRGPTVVVFSQLYLLWFWFDKVLKLNNIDSCCSLVCLQISISYWSCERIDQFRCIKIQPKTTDLSSRHWWIKLSNSVVILQSLVLRFLVLGWVLKYRNWFINRPIPVQRFDNASWCTEDMSLLRWNFFSADHIYGWKIVILVSRWRCTLIPFMGGSILQTFSMLDIYRSLSKD